MNRFSKLYIRKKRQDKFIQDKFTLTKFALCIKLYEESSIIDFIRDSIILKSNLRRLCKYKSILVAVPAFDIGCEAINIFWSFYVAG